MLTHPPLRPRRGLTLVEALVAMFVAALAMISLLALFPLGALQMAQALKDARCTETATNAEALLRDHWRSHVVEPLPPLPPDAVAAALLTGNPVFVDPIGANSGASATVCGQAGLARTNLSLPNSPTTRQNMTFQQALRFCSLQDDMTFDAAALPVRTNGTGPVERAGRYNWTAVLQAAGTLSAVDLTILTFDGRAPGFTPSNSEQSVAIALPAAPTAANTADPLVGSTSIQLSATGLPLAKGRWIALWTSGGTRNARYLAFYRVVSVDDSVAGQLTVELQTPVAAGHSRFFQGTDVPPTTVALTFAGLAEVFVRPQLTSP